MRKRLLLLAAAVAIGGTAKAYEFRAPLISERGPMRYMFDKDKDESYRLNLWSAMHTRESHRAFRSHSTNTKNLPTVFFGKDVFRLSEIFPHSQLELNTEFYNPYMRVLKIAPLATYHERGATFGGRIDFAVWEEKGRIGVRATVPFREIQIECDNKAGRGMAQVEDLCAAEHVNEGEGTSDDVLGYAWRLDFVEALIQNASDFSAIFYEDANNSKEGIRVIGQPSRTTEAQAANASGEDLKVVFSYSPEGLIPRNRIGAREVDHAQGDHKLEAPKGIDFLPTDLGNFTDNKFYVVNDNDYTGLSDDNNPGVLPSVAERLKQQARKAELWMTTVHRTDGTFVQGAATIKSGIENAIKAFKENQFEWMHDRGFDFETDRAFGIGDIDIDLFYEHTFEDNLVGELFLGVRLPTGAGHKYHRNPFEVHMGNGEHFEIRIGGLIAWEPLDWMNIKADVYWSFVLESEEHRAASFKGAQVKNIGPEIEADVDWGYLVLNLDFNFYHSKDKNLQSMIGYQLYYKTEDNVSFDVEKLESWLGKKLNTSTGCYTEDNNYELDNKVMERRTEAVGHRLRFETSYRFSDWFEAFGGSMYTFAGQNLSREADYHAGVNVRF